MVCTVKISKNVNIPKNIVNLSSLTTLETYKVPDEMIKIKNISEAINRYDFYLLLPKHLV